MIVWEIYRKMIFSSKLGVFESNASLKVVFHILPKAFGQFNPLHSTHPDPRQNIALLCVHSLTHSSTHPAVQLLSSKNAIHSPCTTTLEDSTPEIRCFSTWQIGRLYHISGYETKWFHLHRNGRVAFSHSYHWVGYPWRSILQEAI